MLPVVPLGAHGPLAAIFVRCALRNTDEDAAATAKPGHGYCVSHT
jgi:hypothetical protein